MAYTHYILVCGGSACESSNSNGIYQRLLEEAEKHEKVKKEPAPFCRLSKQNASSLDFLLRVWVGRSDYWTVNFDLLEAINNRLVEEKIEIPFTQVDVHVKDSSSK